MHYGEHGYVDKYRLVVIARVADPHRFCADPDSALKFDVDLDVAFLFYAGPYLSFHSRAYPDPNLGTFANEIITAYGYCHLNGLCRKLFLSKT